jgi:hypothetical protein
MDALDVFLIIAGLAGALLVTVGCVVCFVVWLGGQGNGRATEVCAPSKES